MKINIYSWNMQGYSDAKMEACLSKVADDNTIIFLQEMGNETEKMRNLLSIRGGKFELLSSFKDHQAANFRCTTGVIISGKLKKDIYNNSKFYAKGIATRSKDLFNEDVIFYNGIFAKDLFAAYERPLLYLYVNGYYLATKHMTAKSAIAVKETREDIKYLLSNPIDRYDKEKAIPNKGFIMIGDFNSQPEENKDVLKDIHNVSCSHSGEKTHNNGHVLDYCYHTATVDLVTFDNAKNVRNINVKDKNGILLSDHRMIEICLNIE